MINEKVSDGAGGYENELVEVTKMFASVKPVFGRELWESKQNQADISHKFFVRYNKKISRDHIISYNGRLFDVQYIIDVKDERRFLEIQAMERQ